MIIAAALLGLALVIEICAVMAAPIGYQDDSGFHPGEKV